MKKSSFLELPESSKRGKALEQQQEQPNAHTHTRTHTHTHTHCDSMRLVNIHIGLLILYESTSPPDSSASSLCLFLL